MMRYMWICHKELSPRYVEKCLESIDSNYVLRQMSSYDHLCWAFITDFPSYEWAMEQNLSNNYADYWGITSCNKQYVTNERGIAKYIGSLGEVKLEEAVQWVHEDDNNWYLTDVETGQIWMPLQRNPNKMIPTGDAGYCRHCGNTSAQTPGNRYRPLYRPWPLHVDA